MIITDKNVRAYMIQANLCVLSMLFMWWLFAVSIVPPLIIFLVFAWIYGIVAVVFAWLMAFWTIRWFAWNTNRGPALPVAIFVLLAYGGVLIITFLCVVTF